MPFCRKQCINKTSKNKRFTTFLTYRNNNLHFSQIILTKWPTALLVMNIQTTLKIKMHLNIDHIIAECNESPTKKSLIEFPKSPYQNVLTSTTKK